MRPILLLLCLCVGFSGRSQVRDSFVVVPKGQYTIGKRHFPLNPLRKVSVDSFAIAAYETTNRQFAAFVAATGYRTDAERRHDALVFAPGLAEFEWLQDSTACWRYPNGITRGGIDQRMNHPVTCISYSDIQAYCRWAHVRLPTLEEWEIACRAGVTTDYFWRRRQRHRPLCQYLASARSSIGRQLGRLYVHGPRGLLCPQSLGAL